MGVSSLGAGAPMLALMGMHRARSATALLMVGATLILASCGGSAGSLSASAEPGPVDWNRVSADPNGKYVEVQPVGRDHPCVAYAPQVVESDRRVVITVIK
ncbi:hypothetical protein EON81_24870, partial [bacterium]